MRCTLAVMGGTNREHPREIARQKEAVRERVWADLNAAGAARFPGARGRIPNFEGAGRAAERLAGLGEWKRARSAKANPDAPQLPARALLLRAERTLYIAVPRLRSEHPFLRLDGPLEPADARRAVSIKGAARFGQPVAVDRMRRLDLVVCGSVAVSPAGTRIGKGGGYADLELALLVEAGVVDEETVIVTTVHARQVLDEDLPELAHDFPVDLVVTPDEVLSCPRRTRPHGIIWEHLPEAEIRAIPAIQRLRPGR